jgi:exportin-T
LLFHVSQLTAAWVDLTVALTPETLGFYHQVLQQDVTSLRTLAAGILRTFTAKGMRNPSEKLEVLKFLNILSLLDPLESQTRSKEDHDMVLFRASLAGVLQVYGTELIKLTELEDAPEQVRNEADNMLSASIPLILRFLSDRHPEVPTAVSPFVSDLLRTVSPHTHSFVDTAVQEVCQGPLGADQRPHHGTAPCPHPTSSRQARVPPFRS